MVRQSLLALTSVFAALTLSACFTSEDELIGFWAADRPLEEGVWVHWPTHPDGQEWDRETWRGEVRQNRRRYVSEDENFPHDGVRFKAIGETVYIAQWSREDGVAYGVAWVYRDGATLAYHQPDCADLPEAARIELGISPDGEGFCWIETRDQLEAVMAAYLQALGEDIRVDGVYRLVDG